MTRTRGDGALAPSPMTTVGLVPRKREPTGCASPTRKREPTPTRRAPTAVPSPAAFAASSPLIGRGGSGHLRTWGRGATRPVPRPSPGATSFPRKREPTGGRLAYAQAGTYPIAPRPDRSTLSRRVRGVLSPYRERGIRALARPQDGAQRAPSPLSPRGPRHSRESGNLLEAPRLRESGTYRRRAYAQANLPENAIPAQAQERPERRPH